MAYVNAPFLNGEPYQSVSEVDGKVLGRVRTEVKGATPQPGMKDYRFFVDPVSPLPPEVADGGKYGFTGFMSRVGFGYNAFSNEREAEEALQRALGSRFVTFTPAVRNNKYFVIEDLFKEGHTAYMDSDYVPVPSLGTSSLPLLGGDPKKLFHHILTGKPLPGLSKRFWNSHWAPEGVICSLLREDGSHGDMLIAPMEEEPFESSVIEEGGAYFRVRRGGLGYAWIDPAGGPWAGHVLCCNHAPLWFVPKKFITAMRQTLRPVPADFALEEETPTEPEDSEETPVIVISRHRAKAKENLPAPEEASAEEPKEVLPTEDKKEIIEKDFLRRLVIASEEKSLIYEKEDLLNFHISLKSSKLTVLAGMSGIGKSGLVELYAKALGLPGDQLLMLPVRPSWMDDSDILGYADLKNMIYRPADTGLAEFLIRAARHPEKLFIVCFDEMNLARAEYYFAQFISILEKGNNPKIRLYNPSLAGRLYNSSDYPADISIGNNVFFTGTVNVDESTYHFSDKILDRANVITLHQAPFSELIHRNKIMNPVEMDEISAPLYRSFCSENNALSEREYLFLDDVNRTLEKSGNTARIGFRTAKQIGLYLSNIPEGTGMDRAEGLDAEMAQRVLTKFRGSARQLETLFSLDEKGHVTGALPDVLDAYGDVSSFVQTRKVLAQKAGELKLYDYTI